MSNARKSSSLGVIYEQEHFVQFYNKDDLLIKNLKSFVGAGLKNNNVSIIIATQQHIEDLNTALAEEGFDVEKLERTRHYICLDAGETLSKFIVNGRPNRALFKEVIGGLLREVAETGKEIRAFGEMVALLWAEGNQNAAISLERLWNEIADEYSFTLFCAYPMHYFDCANHSHREVGHLHTSVILPEPA